MSDEYGIQGLSGTEIISDVLAQVKKRLEGDCNLRQHDSYSRGYSAKITFHLDLYGLDTTPVDGEFEVGEAQNDPEAEVVEETLEIPQEENLVEVRDRIKDANGSAPPEEEEPEPISAEGVRAKRKYTRKVQQLASSGVIGGTEEFKE